MVLATCAYHGVFTAALFWTFIDIPIDLRGQDIQDFAALRSILGDQFRSICRKAPAGSACVEDLQWQVQGWLEWQCKRRRDPDAHESSLLKFRRFVQEQLSVPTHQWGLSDALRAIASRDHKDDSPGELGSGPHEGDDGGGEHDHDDHKPTTLVLGLFQDGVGRYRDYLMRDILGSLTRVHVCHNTYNDRRRLSEAAAQGEANAVNDMLDRVAVQCDEVIRASRPLRGRFLTCGPCAPPRADNDGAEGPAVVLVTSTKRHGDGQRERLMNARYLKQRWLRHLAILIHVNDETLRIDGSADTSTSSHEHSTYSTWSRTLCELYQGAPLILRTFPDAELFEKELSTNRGGCHPGLNVATIPIGYHAGYFGDTRMTGIEAVDKYRYSFYNSSTSVRRSTWSFVGTRSYRSVVSSHARAVLLNHFTGSQGAYTVHLADCHQPGGWCDLSSSPSTSSGSETLKLVTTATVRKIYQDSKLVLSPRGDSLDCFRHWEAVLSGAVPIVDAPRFHPAWPWVTSGILQMDPPLGFVFTKEVDEEDKSGEEDLEGCTRLAHDAPSIFSAYWLLLNCGTVKAASTAAKTLGVIDSIEAPASGDASKGGGGAGGAQWRSLYRRSLQIGEEELGLRAALNAQWYHQVMNNISGLVQKAVNLRRG